MHSTSVGAHRSRSRFFLPLWSCCWPCLLLTDEVFMIIKRFNVHFMDKTFLFISLSLSRLLLLWHECRRCEKSHFCSIESDDILKTESRERVTVVTWRRGRCGRNENFQRIMMRETFKRASQWMGWRSMTVNMNNNNKSLLERWHWKWENTFVSINFTTENSIFD